MWHAIFGVELGFGLAVCTMCRGRENLYNQSRSPFDASLRDDLASIIANKNEIGLDDGRGG